jgi:hypothetical protein
MGGKKKRKKKKKKKKKKGKSHFANQQDTQSIAKVIFNLTWMV